MWKSLNKTGTNCGMFRFINELITALTTEFIYGVEGPSPWAVFGFSNAFFRCLCLVQYYKHKYIPHFFKQCTFDNAKIKF